MSFSIKNIHELPGWDLGEISITPESPAGKSPRSNEDFEHIEEQVNRLVDIHEHKAVDWSTVAALSEDILRNQGKDLSVAVWFLVARMHTDKLTGLVIGVHVLKDVVEYYWAEMSPPLRRIRARRNIIYWLLDQLKDYLETEQDPVDSFLQQQLIADWKILETHWQTNDEDEVPPFFGLKRTFESLPIKELSEEKVDAVTDADNSLEKNEDDSTTLAEEEQSTEEEIDTAQQSEPENNKIEKNKTEVIRDAPPEIQPLLSKAVFEENPVNAIDNALGSLSELINWGLSSFPISPLFFRLNRVCAWATVESLPLSQDNKTYLPAPTEQLMSSWEKVLHQGDAQAQIHFAESRLSSYRFWLDLNRFSYEALLATDQIDAANVIKAELVQLITRIPNVAELTFSNEQPFADDETKQWMLDVILPQEDNIPSSVAAANDTDLLIQQVLRESSKNSVAVSLAKLQTAIQQTSSLRDAFSLQVAQLEVLVKNRCCVDSSVLISPLLDSLEKYHLIEWEPQLAVKFLYLAIRLITLDLEAEPNQKKLLLRYLSSVSMKDAWSFFKINP